MHVLKYNSKQTNTKISRFFYAFLAISMIYSCTEETVVSNPNVVIILADDMGFGDIQTYNLASGIVTSHLNRLAEEGMKFTDAHTNAAICN